MRRLAFYRSLWTLLGAAVLLCGLWQTAAGLRDRAALAAAGELSGLDAAAAPQHGFVRGTVELLLSAAGRGAGAGRLWPLAGTDALTGETAYIVPCGTGYAVLSVPAVRTAAFAADGTGALLTPQRILARVRRGGGTDLFDGETLRAALGAEKTLAPLRLVLTTEQTVRAELPRGLWVAAAGLLVLETQRVKGEKHERNL